jgi:hypothetical protein
LREAFQGKMPGKPAGLAAGQKNMIRFLHHEPGGGDGMQDAFDRSRRAGPESPPLHDGSVHALHAVQLPVGASTRVEEAGFLQQTDRVFNGGYRGTAVMHHGMAGNEGAGQACRLGVCQSTTPRTAVNEEQGM